MDFILAMAIGMGAGTIMGVVVFGIVMYKISKEEDNENQNERPDRHST